MLKPRKEIMQREKEQRLINLEVKYFQLQMDLAAYEANNDADGVKRTKTTMEQCEKSYAAISSISLD